MQSHILLSPIQSVSGLLVTPTVESAEVISQAPSDSEAETDTANILDPPCNEEHIDSDLPATQSSISIPDANQPDSLDSRCSSSSITDPTSIENAGNCDDQMLYSGSLTTVQTSCIAISSFFHKHHLSKQAQVDLLRLQQQLLPIPNRLPNSLYHFRRVVDFENDSAELHYYCSRCYSPTSSETGTCSNALCGAEVGNNYFIVLPICPQLRKLLSSKYPSVHFVIMIMSMISISHTCMHVQSCQ